MFGIFRFALAQMVAVSHLWPELGFWLGPYAVFSFYLLSGYLMSLVLDRTYAESPQGLARFLTNRVLRIHPPYWCFLAATLVLVGLAPDLAKELNPVLAWPQTAQAWASNLFIFGVDRQPQRLIPPAWSLHVELVFYCVMALGLARRRWLALAWLTASLAWTLHANFEGQHFLLRYLPVQAASLPFSLGSCLYHFRDRLALSATHLWVAVPLFVANAILAPQLWERIRIEGFYASLLAAAYLTLALSGLTAARVGRWVWRIDRWLGDLSYPVFLGHWFAAVLASAWLLGGSAEKGPELLFAGLAVVNLLGWAVHALVVQPLERVRAGVR